MRNRLNVLRAERNLSQAERAERLGVARQTIVAMEANRVVCVCVCVCIRQASRPSQARHANPFGQRVAARCSPHAASSGNQR